MKTINEEKAYEMLLNKADGKVAANQELQNLLDKKGKVEIPKGVYSLTQTLRIYEGTTLIIDDQAVLRWDGNPSSQPMFLNGQKGNKEYAKGYSGDSNIKIIGGTIDLNGKNNPPSNRTGYGPVAFGIGHAQNIYFYGVTMTNGYNNHYVDLCGVKRWSFIGCQFVDMIYTGDRMYEALQVDLQSDNGFPHFGTADNTPSVEGLVSECTFNNVPYGVGSHGMRLNSSGNRFMYKNIRIVDNEFINIAKTAIRLDSFEDTVLNGNIINGYGEYGVHILGGENIDTGINIIKGSEATNIFVTSRSLDGKRFESARVKRVSYSDNGEKNLTGTINVSSGAVNLSESINNFKELIVATGIVSSNNLRHEIARGWRSISFRPGEDFINVSTSNGKFVARIDSERKLTILSTSDPLRYIIGVPK
ncbi:hypothetical protein ACTHQ4_10105 [Alkalicoccobacillus gibsonii]|uniref:hypothetical protein n=1 Tax=Alkalicoccobacillus gibsonii TaxID=79881 RepID=UPI003F7B62BC